MTMGTADRLYPHAAPASADGGGGSFRLANSSDGGDDGDFGTLMLEADTDAVGRRLRTSVRPLVTFAFVGASIALAWRGDVPSEFITSSALSLTAFWFGQRTVAAK